MTMKQKQAAYVEQLQKSLADQSERIQALIKECDNESSKVLDRDNQIARLQKQLFNEQTRSKDNAKNCERLVLTLLVMSDKVAELSTRLEAVR